jgi:tetratricopeptide (TPR) repeat protein
MEENEFQEPSFGDVIELVSKYEEAEKNKQTVFFDEESYESIVQFYQDNGRPGKALKVLDHAIAQYKFSSFFQSKKAEILANQKRFDEAIEALDIAEGLDPNDVNIFLIRADVLLWQGFHSLASEEVERALQLATDPDDRCELYLEQADILEDQERYADVVKCLKLALRENPTSEEALNRMWFCTELLEVYDDSIAFHSALIEDNPYAHLAWFNLGHAHAGVGDFEKSLEAFEFVIAIDEKFEPAYICCGDVQFTLHKYEEALAFYLDAIKISKPNKELYLKVAEVYEQMQDLSRSRSYLRKAITVDPYYDEAFYRIGETYRMEDKWSKAIHSFERAVKLNRDNVDYLAALADAYISTEEGDKALEIFEKIFQIDPQTKQNWVNLATAYFNVENFRKAFQVLSEAEMKYEGSADLFYIKSVFYFQVGNRHEALLNLEKGLLTCFDEHTIIFEMDSTLIEDAAVMQVIEQYRD